MGEDMTNGVKSSVPFLRPLHADSKPKGSGVQKEDEKKT
jgi:hypothetical protein